VLATSAEEVVDVMVAPKIFFMDRVSRGALLLAKSCAEKGAIVMFEPAGFGDKRLFEEALEIAHIVKYSNDRIDRMEGIANKFLLLEIQTLGEEGVRYRSNLETCKTAGWQELKAIPVADLRDAAGAGDWCTAGILDKVGRRGLNGLRNITTSKLNEALAYGQSLAAWNCRFEGARGGMYVESKRNFHSSVKRILESGRSLPEKERMSDGLHKVFSSLCKACRKRSASK
jgi:fructokinase